MLSSLQPQLRVVSEEIGTLTVSGHRDAETKLYLDSARRRLRGAIGSQQRQIDRTLDVYVRAFSGLTRKGQPLAFRNFLLDAPRLFLSLGEKVGAVSHIASFWRYRFPAGQASTASVDEVVDIFQDFETSLGETLAI
jgi:hypothetical protein